MKFIIILNGHAHDFDLDDTVVLGHVCAGLILQRPTGDHGPECLENYELRDRNGGKRMDMDGLVNTILDHGSLVADLSLHRTIPLGPDESIDDVISGFGQVPLNRKLMLRKRLFTAQKLFANTAMDMRRIEENRARSSDTIDKTLAELKTVGPQDHLTPDDLTYAATSCCKCGAGLACVSDSDPGASWACSVVLLTAIDDKEKHDGGFPYSMYNIKEEFQPSANGATTRPAPVDPPTE